MELLDDLTMKDDDCGAWGNDTRNINGDHFDSDYTLSLRKKIASLEWEKIEEQRAMKEKISNLQSQVVHLRNEVEKGETTRQRLEYDIVKAQKSAKYRMKETAVREKEKDEECTKLRDGIRRLETKAEEDRAQHSQAVATQKERVEELEERLGRMRNALEEKMNETKQLLDEKSQTNTEVEVLEGKLDELRQKFVSMSEQCQALRSEMAERNDDLSACRSRELACRKELDTALMRAHNAEEEAEREKASHLEQRYNAELIQLRLREAESVQQTERMAKQEALQLMEELSNKLNDMESVCEEEKKLTANYRHEFERIREEHLASRACLTEELEEKRNAVESLRNSSRRMEEEIEILKKELAENRNEKDDMEDRIRRLHNELLGLVEKATPAEPEGNGSQPRTKHLDAHGLVEQLRVSLSNQRRRIASANDEMSKLKAQYESSARDLRLMRAECSSKEKTLQSTTVNANNSAQEVKTLKRKLVDVERRVSELRAANSEQKRRLDKAVEDAVVRKEEMQRVKKGRRLENEERVNFLSDVSRRLSSHDSIVATVTKLSRAAGDIDSMAIRDQTQSWATLKGNVSEQLTALVTSLDCQKDKINHLEQAMRDKEKFISDLRQSHEAQLFKYENLNQTFNRQKKEMEEHYNKLLQDMQAKSKQSQVLVDQAWERIHASGNLQVDLESECATLRSAVSRLETKSSCLLAALALLLSLHVPTARRVIQLGTERSLFSRLVDQNFASRRRLRNLAAILNRQPSRGEGGNHGGEMEEDTSLRRSLSSKGPIGIDRFRVAVVAVLAANRLQTFGRLPRRHCQGMLLPQMEEEAIGNLTQWLRSDGLLTAVEESMTGLQQQLNDAPSSVTPTAVRSLTALLDRIESEFFPTVHPAPTRTPGLLARQLAGADSLAGRIARMPAPDGSLAETVSEVELGVLGLSRRLMAADTLAGKLREEAEGLEERAEEAERRLGSIRGLRKALEESVPPETHRRMEEELEKSRARERQAQELLRNQTSQLSTLSERVDQLSATGMSRDSEMREAAEMLSRSRVEMKRREQNLRLLSRQVLMLEQEKKVLGEKIDHTDSNLSQWRLERDLCLAYLTAVVELVADSAKASRPSPADVRVVLESEAGLTRCPVGTEALDDEGHVVQAKVNGEPAQLIACRNVVRALAESGVRWQRKAVTAEEKVVHYRRHVAVLKRELAAACQRAVDCPEGLLSATSSSYTPPGPTIIRISPASSQERLLGNNPGQSEC